MCLCVCPFVLCKLNHWTSQPLLLLHGARFQPAIALQLWFYFADYGPVMLNSDSRIGIDSGMIPFLSPPMQEFRASLSFFKGADLDLDLDLKVGQDLDLDLNIAGFAHH